MWFPRGQVTCHLGRLPGVGLAVPGEPGPAGGDRERPRVCPEWRLSVWSEEASVALAVLVFHFSCRCCVSSPS